MDAKEHSIDLAKRQEEAKASKTQKPANCGYAVLATVPYQKCPVCEGVGQIFVNQLGPYNTNSSIGYKPCHVCGGSGIIPMHVLPCNEV